MTRGGGMREIIAFVPQKPFLFYDTEPNEYQEKKRLVKPLNKNTNDIIIYLL